MSGNNWKRKYKKSSGNLVPNRWNLNYSMAPKCAYFGCGKTLSPHEWLFGKYCFTHAQLINQQKTKEDGQKNS